MGRDRLLPRQHNTLLLDAILRSRYISLCLMNIAELDITNKGHTRDVGPGFPYSCRKHFLLTNNETRVSEFF